MLNATKYSVYRRLCLLHVHQKATTILAHYLNHIFMDGYISSIFQTLHIHTYNIFLKILY